MSPGFELTVISPQFPCGAAWLANALLELGVFLPNLWGFDSAREWSPPESGRRRYIAEDRPWLQTLASLQPGREFVFRPEMSARFSHAFPWQLPRRGPLLLMVRDPRDALHSEWRRQQRNRCIETDIDFPQFVQDSFESGPISRSDMLWLHLCCWMDEVSRDLRTLHVLRFEDCKRDPAGSLHAVCRWLDLEVTVEAVRRAVLASDVSHLQRIEAALVERDPQARQFNRRGEAFEWMQSWPASWHSAFALHWQPLLDQLGYDPLQARSEQAPLFDTLDVLSWRGLQASSERDAWAARVDAWLRAAGHHAAGEPRAVGTDAGAAEQRDCA